MSDTTAQKKIQKLQRAIVDALEDVKAQDIRVFNTEALSPLFERVIIASGASNRQTKALAASVRDKVRLSVGMPATQRSNTVNADTGVVFRESYKEFVVPAGKALVLDGTFSTDYQPGKPLPHRGQPHPAGRQGL